MLLKFEYLTLCFFFYISMIYPQPSILSLSSVFTDDTSINLYHPEINYFKNFINDVFASLKKLFKSRTHKVNFGKIKPH
jgi:hypothetical protein